MRNVYKDPALRDTPSQMRIGNVVKSCPLSRRRDVCGPGQIPIPSAPRFGDKVTRCGGLVESESKTASSHEVVCVTVCGNASVVLVESAMRCGKISGISP